MCIFENCKKQPNFNIFGEKRVLYCSSHKMEGTATRRIKYTNRVLDNSPKYNQ